MFVLVMYQNYRSVLCLTLCVVHREAESQLSSDTDLEDPDGKNARTGRGMVCFFKPYTCIYSPSTPFYVYSGSHGALSQSQHA